MRVWTQWKEIDGFNLHLVAGSTGLRATVFHRNRNLPAENRNDSDSLLLETIRQLREYFEGTRQLFDLPLEWTGTEFQQRVWRALLEIPYGKTRSYYEVAQAIGAPKAVRAVGAANGANPLPIVVPCHRVIGANGKLTGYGGGLELKKQLLDLECGAAQFELAASRPALYRRPRVFR